MSEILYLLEMMNGADGISDIEGKAARAAASERGQRASFNGADGISDIEGKATRVGASELGSERVSNDRQLMHRVGHCEGVSLAIGEVRVRADRKQSSNRLS